MPIYTCRVIREFIDEHAATLSVQAADLDEAIEMFQELDVAAFKAGGDYHAADEVVNSYRDCRINGVPAVGDDDWATND